MENESKEKMMFHYLGRFHLMTHQESVKLTIPKLIHQNFYELGTQSIK